MSEEVRTIVTCQDPGDGSVDLVIELPLDILEAMNISLDGLLAIK